MPEASMYKDTKPIAGKNDIRFAGKIFHMQSETKSPSVEVFAQQNFGTGIFTPDTGHHR